MQILESHNFLYTFQYLRNYVYNNGLITSKLKPKAVDENKLYEMYYNFSERIKYAKHFHILAMNRGEEKKILFQPSICGLSIEEVRAYITEYIDRSSSDRILYTLPFSDDCIIQTRKDMENEKIFNQVIKPVEYENSPYTDLVKEIRDFLVCSGFEGEDEYVK